MAIITFKCDLFLYWMHEFGKAPASVYTLQGSDTRLCGEHRGPCRSLYLHLPCELRNELTVMSPHTGVPLWPSQV